MDFLSQGNLEQSHLKPSPDPEPRTPGRDTEQPQMMAVLIQWGRCFVLQQELIHRSCKFHEQGTLNSKSLVEGNAGWKRKQWGL